MNVEGAKWTRKGIKQVRGKERQVQEWGCG